MLNKQNMMKNNSHKIFFLLLMVSLLTSTGCNVISKNKVIARVNNDVITEAEFVSALPAGFASDSAEQAYRQNLIDQMIAKKLFIQEAKKLGLDKEIELIAERDKKSIMLQQLYDDVVTKNVKVSPAELDTAKNLMATEAHVKAIIVAQEDSAQFIMNELNRGVGFDTLAKLYSQHASRANYGDVGFVPLMYFDEPTRKIIQSLKENETSQIIRGESDFKIIKYLGQKPSTEPEQSLKDNAKMVLEQEKSQKLASDYLKKMYDRIEYNPAGLALFYKNPDQITAEEGEIWVARKDHKKEVKAKNLMHVARNFPVSLDTAMRSYAIRREIEDDMLYEDALARKLDKKQDIALQLAKREQDLLYEKFFLSQITEKIDITPAEIESYYNLHKDQYGQSKLAEVEPMIKNTLTNEKKQVIRQSIEDKLKSSAKITINEKLLMSAKKPVEKKVKAGGK